MTTVAAAATVVLVACTSDPPPGNNDDPTNITAPTDTETNASERDAIVAAYDRFWVALHTLDDDPEDTWDETLAEVAVDPQLRISLQAARFQAQNGERAYGEVSARISDVQIDGDIATVEDCQDASKSGIADAKTGEHKTVGVERNPVEARMERHDGTWKVAEITYPDGEC